MMVDITVPSVGESISEVEIGSWLKNEGEAVAKDEKLVVIESDKATLELPAPVSGVVAKIQRRAGEKAGIGETIGAIEEKPNDTPPQPTNGAAAAEPPKAPARPERGSMRPIIVGAVETDKEAPSIDTKSAAPRQPVVPPPARQQPATERPTPRTTESAAPASARGERVVPLSPLRRAIGRRLVAAQRNAALLTTFNEVDMSALKRLRDEERQRFETAHQARLGFMSFFVKATVAALRQVPQLNAEMRDDALVYRDYYDIGIAVGSDKGLVVPVLRDADKLSFAAIEKAIADFSRRAAENQLKPDELDNGTFTISNGGIYGSLLSTPIINPPQSGILGMHAIVDRPVAIAGAVAIRPMMYVALTYDHRVVDGREAVTFLRTIKESIESPPRLLLET